MNNSPAALDSRGSGRPGVRWQAWLGRVLLLAVIGYVAAAFWAGGADTLVAAQRIGLGWIAGGLALTLANMALRMTRWQMLLRAAGARVPVRESAAIYLAGVGLSASPGKLGETVRSVFLLRFGVRVGTSLAAFFIDRLSDLLGVLLLAAGAAALAAQAGSGGATKWALLFASILAAAIALRWLLRSAVLQELLERAPARGGLRKALDWVHGAGHEFVSVWRAPLAVISVVIAVAAYGLQGLIFAGMTHAVAPHVPGLVAIAIFAAATLAGAASFIPGGLGAMELTLVLLLGLQGVEPPGALAAALGLRLVTFWFGLLLGALGLTLAARRHHKHHE